MTPNPQPTRQEQADELAAAAHKAATVGDLVFARELIVRAGGATRTGYERAAK